jgi:hypothetical protein
MLGQGIKYKKYHGHGSGHINIPNSVANALKWIPDQRLKLTIESIKGKTGILISQDEDD